MQQGTQSACTNPQVFISNDNDLANLVATILYEKIKGDLITSGTGIITYKRGKILKYFSKKRASSSLKIVKSQLKKAQ